MNTNHFLPAEWHPQSFIQLTWPHAGTDWAYMLDDVEACFVNLANENSQPPAAVAGSTRLSRSTGKQSV